MTVCRYMNTTRLLLILASAAMASMVSAADLEMVGLDGQQANLQSYRDDGKWSVVLIQQPECKGCDTAELELQQWSDSKSETDVSVASVNVTAQDQAESVTARLNANEITLPNFLISDKTQLNELFESLTGTSLPQDIPVWLLFGNEGHFMGEETGANFDWVLLDEFMSPDGPANELARLLAGETNEPEVKASFNSNLNRIVRVARAAIRRGDLARAGTSLNEALSENPDYSALIVEHARWLMFGHRLSKSNPMAYQLDESVSQKIESELLRVLKDQPAEIGATALLIELYSVTGELVKAAQVMDDASDSYKDSYWFPYNSAMLSQLHGDPAKAIEQLQPVLNSYAEEITSLDHFQFQQAWQLAKTIALEHPEHDPITLVREGLMERISEDAVMEEIKVRSKSETPLMVIFNSQDPGCGPCVETTKQIEPYVKANQDKYQFVYVSIEPWSNISYVHWAGVIPKVTGIPAATVFARSQYMITTSPPVNKDLGQWYDDAYSLVISKNPGELDYAVREAMAELRTAYQLWWRARKNENSAYASVRVGSKAAWGTSEGFTGTLPELEQHALEVCATRAKAKEIEGECRLAQPEKK